jgi:hypothetical protein
LNQLRSKEVDSGHGPNLQTTSPNIASTDLERFSRLVEDLSDVVEDLSDVDVTNQDWPSLSLGGVGEPSD